MTVLEIVLYADAKEVALGPPVASQSVAITGGNVESDALGDSGKTYRCRLYAKAACRIERGENPTADANSPEAFPAGHVEYFSHEGGHKISVISD